MPAQLATDALGKLPQGLRTELIDEFSKITRNYREERWEAAELNGGRFCEVVFTILAGHLNGNIFALRATKPRGFEQSCKKLENADPMTYSDSARLTIPRVLVGLYDIRNRRGVGHVGGDVSANQMDATFVLHTAQWVMAELVRLFHNTSTDSASYIVSTLVDRTLPTIWKIGEKLRVLDHTIPLADATLLLLFSSIHGLSDANLAENLEQDRMANYKRVLRSLHAARMIEYQENSGIAIISPKGIKDVEERLVPMTDI